jgi:hypothetical protein
MGAKMNAYRILVAKQEGKGPLGRPKVDERIERERERERMRWYGLN